MVKAAREYRSSLFYDDRQAFGAKLIAETEDNIKRNDKKGLRTAERLNGTTDYAWEHIRFDGLTMPERFQDVQFYDYTKSVKRARQHANGLMPSNYHLTFSRSEINDDQVADVLARGGNVAAVFSTKMGDALPESYRGRRVIDGRIHDMRFLDPQGGNWVGLSPIGKAKKGSWGFILEV